jgi:hypothetical protein
MRITNRTNGKAVICGRYAALMLTNLTPWAEAEWREDKPVSGNLVCTFSTLMSGRPAATFLSPFL